MSIKISDKIKYLARALVLAFIVTIIFILISSVILTFTNIREGKGAILNTITFLISISVGSIYFSTKSKEKGWINGGIFGFIYSLILIIINIIFLKSNIIDVLSFQKIILGIVIGIIGGIIGINMA